MRLAGFLVAVAVTGAIAGTVLWGMQGETPGAVAQVAHRDGFAFGAVAPSEAGALAPCVACHQITPGGPERSAPSLVGIIGAPVARASWFGYSPALRRHGGDWSRERLDTYLANPTAAVPGTFKTLSPITDPARRKEILDALGRVSAS